MSHIVSIDTQIRSIAGLRAACDRLRLEPPVHRKAKLFSGEVVGDCVLLPAWRYPVVCNVDAGTVQYDNYGGAWGEQVHLDRLMQAYAVETSKLEARRQGYSVMESALADGSIKLTIQVGSAT